MVKRITILGSTGSIGKQTLEVLDKIENKEEFSITGLACNSNLETFIPQIEKYSPKVVHVGNYDAYKTLKSKFPNLEILTGEENLINISTTDTDILLTATTGTVALKPTLCAIDKKIDIALANKETLVMAGDVVMKRAKENGVKILPVDSEHSAILQSSKGNFENIKNIIITASGGPFLNKTKEEIRSASVEQALNHPNWHMGKKITIDSATLMNKGLEVIEAHHLFNMDYKNIKVVIHPESLLHSAIETTDGSVIGQIGVPSMHIPIQYALTYPKRQRGIKTESFDFFDKNFTFKRPDLEKFPCLNLAYKAGMQGGIYPCVLNTANEIAVGKFLKKQINIEGIVKIVEFALERTEDVKNPSIDDIFAADIEAKRMILEKF